MAYVVTDSCRGCRFTECVTVCPVECFHVDDTMTYIDPENCIDCGGCVPVCPVNAIEPDYRLAADKKIWIEAGLLSQPDGRGTSPEKGDPDGPAAQPSAAGDG